MPLLQLAGRESGYPWAGSSTLSMWLPGSNRTWILALLESGRNRQFSHVPHRPAIGELTARANRLSLGVAIQSERTSSGPLPLRNRLDLDLVAG